VVWGGRRNVAEPRWPLDLNLLLRFAEGPSPKVEGDLRTSGNGIWRNQSRKWCAALIAGALAMAVFNPARAATPRTLHIFAYADEFDPNVLDDFTRETGIAVTYDTYASDEALDARLNSGKGGFDVVMMSAMLLPKHSAANHLQALDKSKLVESKGLMPDVMARLASYDPGNRYALPYHWMVIGLTYNEALLKSGASLAWDSIFRPDNLRAFSDCGFELQDSPSEMFALALHYLRLDTRQRTLVDLKRASELLTAMRRYVKRVRAPTDVSTLANGDACLSLGFSSDAVQAQNQAHRAANEAQIGFVAPKGGAPIFIDALAIPADAPDVAEAYVFLRFLMRPDIAARNSKAMQSANPITEAKALLPQALRDNPAIYPDEVTMKSLYAPNAFSGVEQAFIGREWVRIKSGK